MIEVITSHYMIDQKNYQRNLHFIEDNKIFISKKDLRNKLVFMFYFRKCLNELII